MTGMEYLTPDGQQLTLDVTACVCVWGGAFLPQKPKSPKMDKSEVKNFPHSEGGGGGFSATKTKVTQNHPKWINPKSKIFLTLRGGGLFCHKNQSEVQGCMNYQCVKLRHVPQYESCISPKGRKEGGGAFRPICSL